MTWSDPMTPVKLPVPYWMEKGMPTGWYVLERDGWNLVCSAGGGRGREQQRRAMAPGQTPKPAPWGLPQERVAHEERGRAGVVLGRDKGKLPEWREVCQGLTRAMLL